MTSLIVSVFNALKPYLKKIGLWVLEKLVNLGLKATVNFLARRIKSLKRRVYRLSQKLVYSLSEETLLEANARMLWLAARIINYQHVMEYLSQNRNVISKSVGQRLLEFAENSSVTKRVGSDECFETWGENFFCAD